MLGRDEDLATLQIQLDQVGTRLITLVGPPGVGKTLLAQHLAVSRGATYPDGAAFVALDSIHDVNLVPARLMQSLGLREQPGRTLVAVLQEHLRDKQLLLVLDNFEQVIGAAGVVAEILAACPGVRMLVTSRSPLRISWESQTPVEPLPSEQAVELFLARARAIRPSMEVTSETARDVESICARLEGLPLAIELAASRAKLLSPGEIAERLTDHLAFLSGGSRDLPSRHQALRAALDWSYALLSSDEQWLFRLLGVFTGGCTFDGLEAVALGVAHTDAAGPGPALPARIGYALLDLLAGLADHSLVRRFEDADGTSRFRMLETIREYAVEQLEGAGEAPSARRALLAYCLKLAAQAEQELTGADPGRWVRRLDAEQDSMRGTLGWAVDGGEVVPALALASALHLFWLLRGQLVEGRAWAARILAGLGAAPGPRAEALRITAQLALRQCEYVDARLAADAALVLDRDLGDERGMCDALNCLGAIAYHRSDFASARAYAEDGLAIARRLGDPTMASQALVTLGNTVQFQGELGRAAEHYQEAIALSRRTGDLQRLSVSLGNLALLGMRQADFETARNAVEEAIALQRRLGGRYSVSRMLSWRATIAAHEGDTTAARRMLEESLNIAREVGDPDCMAGSHANLADLDRAAGDLDAAGAHAASAVHFAASLDDGKRHVGAILTAARVAADRRQYLAAARLFSAAQTLTEFIGFVRFETEVGEAEAYLARIRAALGDTAFAQEWTYGSGMGALPALAYARTTMEAQVPVASAEQVTPGPLHPPRSKGGSVAGLTARELEVLRLLAGGHSNREIGAQLAISERTVEHHIANIYGKIDARGRVDAASFAHRHGLLGA
jgi:predicted ATPase/DNA-binding CsgD family transcriptional regulator